MAFDVLPIQRSPLGAFWQPRLAFTGTTVYGVSPSTGKVERHVDTWDSIRNQRYFSAEGFADVLRQIFAFEAPARLTAAPFRLLKCASQCRHSRQCHHSHQQL